MTTAPTTAELEQQLAQTRAAEQAATDREAQARHDRETSYRRQRLAAFDDHANSREVRATWATFLDALEETPAFAAFADALAARWRQHRARNTAADDRAYLARQRGEDPGYPEHSSPPPTDVALLLNAIVEMVSTRVQRDTEQADADYSAAVFGEGLTMEQIIEAEQRAEVARRADAARSATAGSVDVTGMSDDDRKAAGLPAGSSRSDRDR